MVRAVGDPRTMTSSRCSTRTRKRPGSNGRAHPRSDESSSRWPPGVDRDKASHIAAFLAGPETFASFDDILERTIRFNPTRSVSSLRRGVLHNAVRREDGSWTWRHQMGRPASTTGLHVDSVDFGWQWDVLERIGVPVLLARGSLSPVVDGADVAEFRRRRPSDEVVVVDGAGHSIQGDRPLELARIITGFLDGS